MLQFSVDTEKCIQCGECSRDCPYQIIEMRGGYPVIDEEKAERCIECQHCLAVCEPGALSIFGLDPSNSIPLEGCYSDAQALEVLMMGRRSVRRYDPNPVDTDLVDHLLEVVRHAPTGVNNRSTLFTLVEGDDLKRLRDETYEGIRSAMEIEGLPPGLEFFSGIMAAWDNGVDVLFRGAPHLLVVSSPSDGPCPVPDALIAMSYFDVLAAAHGLGTVWDGLLKWGLTQIAPEAGRLLEIPENHTLGYMMMFGKPAVRYHRTVQRPGGTVRRVSVSE